MTELYYKETLEGERWPNKLVSCNACGASTLYGNEYAVKHYEGCGGIPEIEKWEEYYKKQKVEEFVDSKRLPHSRRKKEPNKCCECGTPATPEEPQGIGTNGLPICSDCHSKYVKVVVHDLRKKDED